MNLPILLKHFMFFIFGILLLGGCSKKNLVSQKASSSQSCKVDSTSKQITNAPCTLKFNSAADQYFYDTQNGGVAEITAQSVTGTLSSLENGTKALQSYIPDGYVSVPITFTLNLSAAGPNSSSLTASANFISSGISIFGVTGTYAKTGTLLPCKIGDNTGANCLGSGFVYADEYDNRTGSCSLVDDDDDTLHATDCFLSESYLEKTTGNPPTKQFLSVYAVKQSELTNYPVISTDYSAYSIYNASLTATSIPRLPKDMFIRDVGVCPPSTPSTKLTDCLFVLPKTTSAQAVNFSGSAGGASGICDEDGKLNPTSCTTQGPTAPGEASRYVYGQPYGNRLACTAGQLENCYITEGSKVTFSGTESVVVDGVATDLPLLRAENIKAGIQIFGIMGSAGGENDWPSGMHRDSNSPSYTLLQEGEAQIYGLSADTEYYQIPKITLSNDGNSNSVNPVNRSGWNNSVCGIDASLNTVDKKIADCSKLPNSKWNGIISGNAGQMTWKLVMRTGNVSGNIGKEVWQDTGTGMLWSSLVSTGINWCRASGAHTISGLSLASASDPANICDNVTYQNIATTFLSACKEVASESAAISGDLGGRLSLGLASTPKVDWRIPTLYDYEIAEYHGLRFVLPDIGVTRSNGDSLFEWTGTLDSKFTNLDNAFVFHSRYGYHDSFNRKTSTSGVAGVRCIGHAYN